MLVKRLAPNVLKSAHLREGCDAHSGCALIPSPSTMAGDGTDEETPHQSTAMQERVKQCPGFISTISLYEGVLYFDPFHWHDILRA